MIRFRVNKNEVNRVRRAAAAEGKVMQVVGIQDAETVIMRGPKGWREILASVQVEPKLSAFKVERKRLRLSPEQEV